MLMIGTTGHRDIEPTPELLNVLDRALETLLDKFPSEKVIVMSPLAEGADRLIYKRMRLIESSTKLHAILPLEMKEYLEDFTTQRSKEEFLDLIEGSYRVDVVITRMNTLKAGPPYIMGEDKDILRDISYEASGHLMVDMCDVLVAIWDGKKARGRGGTGEVVAHARRNKIPLVWIHSNDHFVVRYENIDGI